MEPGSASIVTLLLQIIIIIIDYYIFGTGKFADETRASRLKRTCPGALETGPRAWTVRPRCAGWSTCYDPVAFAGPRWSL